MAQISAKPESMKVQVNNLASVVSKIQRIETQLYDLSAQIRYTNSTNVYRKVANSIQGSAIGIRAQKTSISKMKSGLNQVQRIYKNTENSVEGTFHKKSNVDWNQTTWFGLAFGTSESAWNSNWNSFFHDLKENGKFSDSVYESALGISGAVFGEEFSTKIGQKVGNVEADVKYGGEWNITEGDAKLYAKGSAGASAWQGYEETKFGLYSNEATVSLLTGAVSGEAAVGLYKNGKFDPSFGLNGKIGGSVAKGEVDHKFGTDDVNAHIGAEGEALGANAEAGVKISKEGLQASAGAEAYALKGEVKSGFDFFGIKIDVELEGTLGSVGAKASVGVSEDSVSGEVGAALLGGAGVKVNVDWSELARKISKWKW